MTFFGRSKTTSVILDISASGTDRIKSASIGHVSGNFRQLLRLQVSCPEVEAVQSCFIQMENVAKYQVLFLALTVLLVETTELFGGLTFEHHRHDLKMKSLFFIEAVFLAGVALLSQATAKVRPNASGISRTEDGGSMYHRYMLKYFQHLLCKVIDCKGNAWFCSRKSQPISFTGPETRILVVNTVLIVHVEWETNISVIVKLAFHVPLRMLPNLFSFYYPGVSTRITRY